MDKYHREIHKKWKRATQKRRAAENKAARDVAARLLGVRRVFDNGDIYEQILDEWTLVGHYLDGTTK